MPTGNFGDIFAGYVRQRMGLPIERLAIATNDNDILPARAASTGVYALREVVATTSPSMDIQVSSNFERFLFEACGPRCRLRARPRWTGCARAGRSGSARRMVPYARDFVAGASARPTVADCIRRVKAESGYLLDPHSACGVVAARKKLSRPPARRRALRSPPPTRPSSPTPCRRSPASARPCRRASPR